MRAKLFYKKASGSEFTELGIGQMRVLPGNGEGVKAVMRNDTSLSKVHVVASVHLDCCRLGLVLSDVVRAEPPITVQSL